MSRLIVKNLPKNITDTKLKELFSEKGLVTDVRLKYTKDGKFRRFAFVGYKTEEQAKLARSYFDQTFVDTCKITVEQCASLGDSLKPRSWSKYASDSSRNETSKSSESKKDSVKQNDIQETKDKSDKERKKKKIDKKKTDEVKEALEKRKDAPLFMEFLESHTADNNIKSIWKNDIDISGPENEDNKLEESKEEEGEEKESKSKEKIADKVMSDLEYMEALKKKGQIVKDEEKPNKTLKYKPLFTAVVRGLGYKHAKKHIKQFFRPVKASSIRIPPKIKGIAYVGFKTEQAMKKALMKNKSFLDGKRIFVSKYERKETIKSDDPDNKTNVKWKKQEEALRDEESIAESGRIFIRNLTYTTTEDDVRKLFEKYGPLSEVNLPVDRVTRKPKGFGTVTFLMPEHATKAYTELDGSVLDGRMLHILPGKAKDSLEDIDTENLTYKRRKELRNKATAGLSRNWNTLFLGSNAVADAIASRYNTTKENLLVDQESNGVSAAVKLALGETQLIHDTRNFLEENGVCLDAFNQAPKKRSTAVILVKNLPSETKPSEIREMFAKYGELARVVTPPVGITALVEFLEPSEAREAFHSLAYKRYKHLPLYLEWAPDNSFATPASKTDGIRRKAAAKESVKTKEVTTGESRENNDNVRKSKNEEPPEPDTTLFVKNINFATTEEQLKEYFGKCGPVHYVTIATKLDPENSGKRISMGYGFVRFKRKHDADHALKTLQMSVLDGKSLELKRSERTLMSDVKTTRKKANITEQTSAKILVRNVPFQATRQEITELFKSYGEPRAVRLPKKLVGAEKHRGFAFVEYYRRTDAKKAFKALCQSTHLYGRRLVLEWAQAERDIKEIRKRTAKQFYQGSAPKKFKKSTIDVEAKST